jgi:cyclopropane-fatty-acyl-phospholipid synthase
MNPRMSAQMNAAESLVREMFGTAGVTINGTNPGDIQVKDPRFYGRFVRQASMGFGESYMEGWWECEALDILVEKLLRANLRDRLKGNARLWLLTMRAILTNMQRPGRAAQVAEAHYDLGNDLYEAMLDKRMIYTCGYWKNANSLEQAQEHKLDLVCRKAGLRPGMKVLDLGCGWGGFAAWAAEK